jgi:hypothetical protein
VSEPGYDPLVSQHGFPGIGGRVVAWLRVVVVLAVATTLCAAGVAMAASGADRSAAAAKGKTAKGKTGTKTGTGKTAGTKTGTSTSTRTRTRTGKTANSKKDKAVAAKPEPVPPPKGKVAVLAFDGDGADPLRARVVRLLRAKGLKVITNLRAVDTPEQYREMADTLVLVAFLDGEASEDGEQASVTVHVRSGVSGLRVASATLAGERRKLPATIDKELWAQLAPPLSRACADAAKPRKREREPMRIEAGTPLDAADPPKGT